MRDPFELGVASGEVVIRIKIGNGHKLTKTPAEARAFAKTLIAMADLADKDPAAITSAVAAGLAPGNVKADTRPDFDPDKGRVA